jgi:endonuclease-3
MNKAETYEFFKRLRDERPNPIPELDYHNHFTLLVAVVLSAQATDIGVNKATKHLFAIADTPHAMVALGEDAIRDHVKTIGLYKAKAANVFRLSQLLIDNHNGIVPDTEDALVALPGVGRKTANVVLNIAFGKPTLAVDTHVFRVGNRTRLAPAKNVEETERKLLKKIPDEFIMNAHHWLILHGRYVCKARKPDCANCVVYDLCGYKDKSI